MKPLLAATLEDVTKLRFPVVVSPKFDGVRAIVKGGVVLSRTLKPIPNKFVQTCFAKYEHMDGELIVGLSNAPDVYRKTVSGVMSVEGEPDVTFCVFDYTANLATPFHARFSVLRSLVTVAQNPRLERVAHHVILTPEELIRVEEDFTKLGYEGLMIRDPSGIYKCGRSTVNEGILLKLKRFTDAEAEVIGFEELMHNHNEAEQNELGNTKRSSHKENLVGGDTLGALLVRNCTDGVEFKIGTGFTAAQRQELWQDRRALVGKLATYKSFPVGVKDAPRHPVFKGFRDRVDT